MSDDAMLPMIRQMLDADGDRARAGLLLAAPDLILMKYRPVFEGACARAAFAEGRRYIDFRRAGWHAVRDADGLLPAHFDAARAEFAAFARSVEP